MKVIIEFTGEDRDVSEQAVEALTVYRLRAALERIRMAVHRQWKWGEWEHDETAKMIDELYHEVYAALAEAGADD